jgi:hypothetical protein
MPHVKQGLLLTELNSTPVFGGFHIAQSSVFFAMLYTFKKLKSMSHANCKILKLPAGFVNIVLVMRDSSLKYFYRETHNSGL